jgi:aminocarboxymuconate-semialdehyde decarboxylase
MKIDMQAISPSPILLFYWEEPQVAAHFSRKQNEAIQEVVKKHPDRFVGFGSVPLQSVPKSIRTRIGFSEIGCLKAFLVSGS